MKRTRELRGRRFCIWLKNFSNSQWDKLALSEFANFSSSDSLLLSGFHKFTNAEWTDMCSLYGTYLNRTVGKRPSLEISFRYYKPVWHCIVKASKQTVEVSVSVSGFPTLQESLDFLKLENVAPSCLCCSCSFWGPGGQFIKAVIHKKFWVI